MGTGFCNCGGDLRRACRLSDIFAPSRSMEFILWAFLRSKSNSLVSIASLINLSAGECKFLVDLIRSHHTTLKPLLFVNVSLNGQRPNEKKQWLQVLEDVKNLRPEAIVEIWVPTLVLHSKYPLSRHHQTSPQNPTLSKFT
jgi:hypothetical protein